MVFLYAAAVLLFDRAAFWPRIDVDAQVNFLLSHPAAGLFAGVLLIIGSGVEVSRTEYSTFA